MKGGVVHIVAIEGKELAAKDSNGKSDPYVKITMLGSKSKKGAEQKTKPIDKTLEPVWNHKFNPIPYDNEDYSAVQVTLFDKDKVGSDDFMGQIWVPIYEIRANNGKLDKWFQLVTNEDGENVSGFVHLSFEILSDEEAERKKKEEQKRIEEEKNRKQEEETKKKLEEQEKMLKVLNEKKKELEEQRNQKITQQKLTTNIPPPITSSNSFVVNTTRVGNATCNIQFVGQSETELSLNVGDDVTVEDRSDPNWWYATNHTTNKQGYIPSTGDYISFSTSKIGNATCSIQFVGQSETELSLNVGDDVTVEDHSDPNWWYATNHTTNKQGYIPAVGGYVSFN